ncbi:MAG: TetR-like C-terminal domain-containing protein [Eubacterium sp.]
MDVMERHITNEFMKLLKQHAFNKITVKMLTEKCEISRHAFYYHFSCLADVPERYFIEQVEKIVEQNYRVSNFVGCLIKVEEFTLKRKTEIIHILHSDDHRRFQQAFRRVCDRGVRRYIQLIMREQSLSDKDMDLLIHFYSSAIEGLLLDWFDADMMYDIVSMTRRLGDLLAGSIDMAFRITPQKDDAGPDRR